VSGLLKVDDLVVQYRGRRGAALNAVDGVSFEVPAGTTVGLVGESGSGKSSIGRAILGLARPHAGRISFADKDITSLHGKQRRLLSTEMQAIFQDPYSSLDPLRTVKQTLTEPLRSAGKLSRGEADATVSDLLARVKLPADTADRYPAQFSGGQRQRVAIARALAMSPRLVICDEPVSALDLSTQAQVINLLAELQRRLGLSYLFISHDLAVVRRICSEVVVVYRGRVMEQGPAAKIYGNPRHPYTRTLLASAPIADPVRQRERRLLRQQIGSAHPRVSIAGSVSDSCPFASRCPSVAPVCTTSRPARITVDQVQLECHMYDPASGHPQAESPDPALLANAVSSNGSGPHN
jgi:oligopeptide/dipeptide ABC transporter ATP-binding protein